MNKTLERFYLQILTYAGLKIERDIIVNVNEKLGDFKVDDKHLVLPYYQNLKNPGDNHIFHPLNENFATPENTHFNLYKKKLTYELNMRLCTLVISLLRVGSDPTVQQRLKKEAGVALVSGLGEIEMATVEKFMGLVLAAQKDQGAAFLMDIYLKKNGSIDDTPYMAIGKVNFSMYRELQKALEDKEKGYKVYGYNLGKKHIISLISVFDSVFPNINNADEFSVGTDNKVFRYLSALLLASHLVAKRMNTVADLLKDCHDPSLSLEDAVSDLSWTDTIEDVYPLTNEIREIPNQTCLRSESNQLRVDESKIKEETQTSRTPVYSPPQQQQLYSAPQQQTMAQMPQQQQMPPAQAVQHTPTPEEIIRGAVMQQPMMMPGMMPVQPGMVPMQPGMVIGQPGMGYPQPGMMYPQGQVPGWGQTQFSPQAQQMLAQTGMVPGMVPMQTSMVMVPAGTQMMGQQTIPVQTGIPLNPHLMGNFR